MRPRKDPSDLRCSSLQPNRELREVMRPKPLRCTENDTDRWVNDLEESINTKKKELESGIKTRDKVIKRLRACIDDNEQKEEDVSLSDVLSFDSNVVTDAYDTPTEEGEVQPSAYKLTNVLYSENENTVSTPIPGPSRARSNQTKVPGPPTKSKSQEEKPIENRPLPIKYPEANELIEICSKGPNWVFETFCVAK